MKHILLIATGGTIASRPTENGLAPQLLADDILRGVPALGSLCRIDAVQPMNIDRRTAGWRWPNVCGSITTDTTVL